MFDDELLDDILVDEESDIDRLLQAWLNGDDVSEDTLWEEWDLKYANDTEESDDDV